MYPTITGQFEAVYNVRVADWHTYFVGEVDWGWTAWTHSAYVNVMDRPTMPERAIADRKVYGTAQNTEANKGIPDEQNAHFNWVNEIVAELARNAPVGAYFVLNWRWDTALNRNGRNIDYANKRYRKRPDILIVQPLDPPGTPNRRHKIHAVEVMSLRDRPRGLTARLSEGWSSVITHNNEIL